MTLPAAATTRLDELDGIPVIWTPVPGPLRAALTFRVGQADETFPTRGITHLVEHLALSTVDRSTCGFNGFVDAWRTTFHCQGSPDEVTEFFATVSRSLAALPFERIDTEKRLIRTEASRKNASLVAFINAWRFGARGYGLVGGTEHGLEVIREPHLREWVETRFTRGNAVLWLTGEPPAGLRVALPDGPRQASPAPTPLPLQLPGWITADMPPGVVGSMVGPSGWVCTAAQAVMQKRLYDRLRDRDGVSYGVDVDSSLLMPGWKEVLVSVDGLADVATNVAHGFYDTMNQLLVGDVDAADVEWWRSQAMQAADDETAGAMSRLDRSALATLSGTPLPDHEQDRTEIDAVNEAMLHDWFARAGRSLLAVVGPNVEFGPRWSRQSDWSGVAVEGVEFTPTSHGSERLVIGDAGITLRLGAEQLVTVKWDECSGALRWTDGSTSLVGADGMHLRIRRDDWQDFMRLSTMIERRVPASLVVPMGEPPERTTPAAPVPAPLPPVPPQVVGFQEAPREALPSRSRYTWRAGSAYGWGRWVAALFAIRLLVYLISSLSS